MATSTQTTYDVDIEDVEYLRHGDKPLLARLFKPRGSGPFPIMVELHGGAWVRGDRLNGNVPNRQYQDLWYIISQRQRIEDGRCRCHSTRKSPSVPGAYDH